MEQGFVAAGKLKLGMHVLRADGTYSVVTGWKVVPGSEVMYNLEVAQDHTFTVGTEQWVVHNDCSPAILRSNLGLSTGDPFQAHHVLPCECEQHDLVQAAGDLFDINADYNGRKLYDAAHKFDAFAIDEPYHQGSHPDYNRVVRGMLDYQLQDLQATGSLNPANARDALFDVIDLANDYIDVIGAQGLRSGAPIRLY